MKILTLSIFLLIIAMGLCSCSSSKSQQDILPFTITEASYVYWVAGVRGGGSGVDFQIKLEEQLNENIKLDSLYFKNMGAKLEFHSKENLYSAHFISNQNTNDDLILSSDPNEEFKNKLPLNASKSPIALNDNEALLTYLDNGEKRYFKIQAIVERESSKFPLTPNNH